jgi:hypothetical protein
MLYLLFFALNCDARLEERTPIKLMYGYEITASVV